MCLTMQELWSTNQLIDKILIACCFDNSVNHFEYVFNFTQIPILKYEYIMVYFVFYDKKQNSILDCELGNTFLHMKCELCI